MSLSLPEVVASNKRIASTFPNGLVAVFVGGTSGVGEYTVQTLAKYLPNTRVYIIGRNQEAADRIIKECQKVSSGGQFEFIPADVSSLKSVDDVCRQLKAKETAINLLFMTQGSMAFKSKTSEGLPMASGLVLHSRLRFVLNLLPLIQKADTFRRVVSVMAATCEDNIDLKNILGEGFPLLNWRNQMSACQTLLLSEIAKRAPDVSVIHALPGAVKGGIMRNAEGFRVAIIIAISKVLEPLVQIPAPEAGERHLFVTTSAMFPAREAGATVAGVPLEVKLAIAQGIDGHTGSGMYSIDQNEKVASPKVEKLLAKYLSDGTADKVWNYVVSDFKRITGTESMTE